MENNNKELNYTIPSIFSRFIVGFGAGFIGTVVLGIILFLSWKVVGGTLSPEDVLKNEFGIKINENQTHPLFLSIVTLAIFLSTMVANLAYGFLSSIVEKKYTKPSTILTHIFFGNLILLLFMLPAYLIASHNFNSQGIALTAVLHATLGTLFSMLVIEALHQSKYLIVNFYGSIFGIILFFFFGNILISANPTTLTLLTLPILIGLMSSGNRFVEVIYDWLISTYGIDFLNTETLFGKDYGEKGENNDEDISDFDI